MQGHTCGHNVQRYFDPSRSARLSARSYSSPEGTRSLSPLTSRGIRGSVLQKKKKLRVWKRRRKKIERWKRRRKNFRPRGISGNDTSISRRQPYFERVSFSFENVSLMGCVIYCHLKRISVGQVPRLCNLPSLTRPTSSLVRRICQDWGLVHS